MTVKKLREKTGEGRYSECYLIPASIHSDSAGGVSWSPDGRYLACGKTREVRVYDSTTQESALVYNEHTEKHRASGDVLPHSDCVGTVTWSPDGTCIASAGWQTIHVWNARTGATLATYIDHKESIRDITWSHDSQYIASASNDGTVHIWEAKTGTRLFTYERHRDKVASVAWSPDGRRIASASSNGVAHVWQAF